jgi:DNA-binding protein H-NS
MSNPMDAAVMQSSQSMETLIQQARQNPQAFENYVKQTMPQAYQQALQIRNCQNPLAVITQMAQQRGINPNILKMFGFT